MHLRAYFRILFVGTTLILYDAPTLEVACKNCFANDQSLVKVTSPFAAIPEADLYWAESNCCGITATFMVSSDLGCKVGLNQLAAELPISADGTSMGDLVRVIHSRGLSSVAAEMTEDELYSFLSRNPNARAIALVRPSHWIAIFAAADNGFQVFTYPDWGRSSRAQMRAGFRGPVILVNKEGAVETLLKGPNSPGGSFFSTLTLLLVIPTVTFAGISSMFIRALSFRIWRTRTTSA